MGESVLQSVIADKMQTFKRNYMLYCILYSITYNYMLYCILYSVTLRLQYF